MVRYVISAVLVAVFTAEPVFAQAKAPPVEKPVAKAAVAAADKLAGKDNAGFTALKAAVKSVSGIVERLSGDDKNARWKPLKVGDILSERTLVRTGLGGSAVLKFADRGDVTVKSGTKIGISSFRKSGKLVKTRLGLKYGALRAKVDSSRGANDFRVRTAVATLAATGTSGNMAQWGDFSLQFQGTTGAWKANTDRKITTIRRGEWTDRNAAQSLDIVLDKLDPKIGDPHGGLTKAETVEQRKNPAGITGATAKGKDTFTGRKRSRQAAVVRKLKILIDRNSSTD